MGLFSKLKPKNILKKSLGVKLVKKAIAKDPIGSKVLAKSKGAQALGLVDKRPRAANASAVKTMNTSGNTPPSVVGSNLMRSTPEDTRPGIRGRKRGMTP